MKLGKAFSDAVIIEQKARARFGRPKASRWWLGAGRALMFAAILCIALFVLGWRLFDLTLIRGHEFRALADGNRTRELVRHAPRGRIFDRTGKLLADNTPTSDYDYTRVYPAGTTTSHVVGYTGEITRQEVGDQYYHLRGYQPGDRIGRMGAEAVYEERLRGRNGREFVEINASGAVTRILGTVEEIPGEDVSLALDRGVAEAAAGAFPQDAKGAVVVSRPMTGEVLALYTSPSFDANIFSDSISKQTADQLFGNPDLPMLNRAIGGNYPPGSTFKIVTAIAGLEEAAMTSKTLFEDTGELVIGPFRFPNWYFTKYGKTEGLVDIIKAIQRSNDLYFYKAGEALGITKLANWAKRLGVGAPLGIEIPGEASGLMPDPAWKAIRFDSTADREARNDQWYLGDTYHVAIGQGYLLTTPLQVNVWTNVVANRGKLCRPTIQKISNVKFQISNCKDVGIHEKTIDLITEGMTRACEPGGTGWPLFHFQVKSKTSHEQNEQEKRDSLAISVPLACKTGTAEFGDPGDRTHAWFTAFAPVPIRQWADSTGRALVSDSERVISGEPEISVTVIVEGAGEGSDVAAPIAKKILEEWFSR